MIIENYLPDTKSSSVKKREALLSLVVGDEFPGSALLAHINNYNSNNNNNNNNNNDALQQTQKRYSSTSNKNNNSTM